MSEWMKHLHWKQIFTSGLIVSVVMMVVHEAEAFISLKYYMDPSYFPVWSTLMMPNAGPPPIGFFGLSFLFTLATAVTMAAVFDFTKALFGKGYWKRVIGFTDIMVGLTIVFAYFPMYLMIRLPVGLLATWTLTSFVAIFLGSMIFAKKLAK